MQNKITLTITMSFGVERLVADELKALGYYDLKIDNGYIELTAPIDAIAKTNIWLRCAARVFWKVTEFKAANFDELFDQIKAFSWVEILPKDACFPISDVVTRKSKLFSKSDCQAMTKKAIVESLKQKYSIERFPETGALFPIRLQIINDVVSVLLDTSGDGLNKRGYRAHHHEAPIRETLAASMITLTGWGHDDRVLMDPTCGAGTLLIEAAMIAKNIAPGKYRKFAAETWPIIPKNIWDNERKAILDLENKNPIPKIFGSDTDNTALSIAKKNIEIAGFSNDIFAQKLSLKDISSKYERGIMISNPPYGERLLEQEETEELYREMGKVFKERFPQWSYYIITPNENFEKLFGKKSDKNRKLYNGPIKCYIYQYIKR